VLYPIDFEKVAYPVDDGIRLDLANVAYEPIEVVEQYRVQRVRLPMMARQWVRQSWALKGAGPYSESPFGPAVTDWVADIPY